MTYLAVTNIEAARHDLTRRGLVVSAIRHKSPIDDWKGDWQPGTDPERRDYASLVDFGDPDGNTWVITPPNHERAPGGGLAAAASGSAYRPGGKPVPHVRRKETQCPDVCYGGGYGVRLGAGVYGVRLA